MGIKITGNTRGLRQTQSVSQFLICFYFILSYTHTCTHTLCTHISRLAGVWGRLSDNTLDFKSAPGRVYAPLAAIVGYAPHVLYVYFSHTFPADWRSFLLLLCCPPPPLRPHPVVVVSFCWRCCSLSLRCPPVCGCWCGCGCGCVVPSAVVNHGVVLPGRVLSACACCGSPALRCFYSTVDCLKCKFALIIPWQATSATASLQQQRSRRRRPRHRRHPLTPKQGPQHER